MNASSLESVPSLIELRKASERAARAFNVRLIILFGSAARGEARVADLDIGVLGRERVDLVELTNQLIRTLHEQHVDVCDLGRADPLLMALVARDGVPLYEATPGEFARFASLAVRRYADTRKFREVERREIGDFLARTSHKA